MISSRYACNFGTSGRSDSNSSEYCFGVSFILNDDDDFDLYPQNARRSKSARGSRDSGRCKAHQCELIHFDKVSIIVKGRISRNSKSFRRLLPYTIVEGLSFVSQLTIPLSIE